MAKDIKFDIDARDGLAPAATFFNPSLTIACAKTVAVVVPSPAKSLVLEATSLTI